MPKNSMTSLMQYLRRLVENSQGGAEDAELLERFAESQDEAAFRLLVLRHGPLVFGLCQRMLQHEQDSEDAFQATFLTLARKAGSIGKKEALAGWLYKVAYRVACRARSKTPILTNQSAVMDSQ